MDIISKVSEATSVMWATLMRDYYLTIGLLVLVLVFAIYLYLSPTATEFFTGTTSPTAGSTKKQNTR
jgi:hypothetical protein